MADFSLKVDRLSLTDTNDGSKRIVIIGAGPCGLGAAFRLKELGHTNFVVLDQSPEAGGLSCTVRDEQGFLWDMGGHVVFSHYQYFDKVLDLVVKDWCERERVCYVWQKGRFIPYPYQNNIHRLPQEDLKKCLDGLIDLERRKNSLKKPTNFYEWLENSFGRGIMDIFLVPYNQKVWGYHPKEMNTEWMGERVATVDLGRIMNNILQDKDDASWGPNNKFRFPLRGGTGAIWEGLYRAINKNHFVFNASVTQVDADNKVITLSDGSRMEYDALISTMPLDKLCTVVSGQGLESLPSKAAHFRYSTTHVVGIGLDGPCPEKLRQQCWMYFPEDDCPFYRVTVFSNYSPYHVPKPGRQWSLMAEVCETCNRPVNRETIVEEVVQGFINTKLISKDDVIVSRFHTALPHGYPTPFKGRDELCKPIFDALEDKEIYSRGRFGAWKYEVSNQDHTMMQGVEAADHILFGTEEMTFRFPSVVNAPSWKSIGRTPRAKPTGRVVTHDPAVLIRDMLENQQSFETREQPVAAV